ncbi:hypothetical protein CFI00_13015 [Nocardioides sp. S5]|uniref:hypothetical protein n=1 Tax=Nocardioides sp. S5 TaxID=2017486 RepID=UPI001A8E5946|nr:hypothetical protein [Nocardioides sp. S5]QSR31403.1 hypothetical protein CFI00_13015 [Nocardioides sp. S5]
MTTGDASRAEHHAFVDGDVGRCGAILRDVASRSLRTRTVFRMGDDAPLYIVDHVVDHDGDVRRWRRFTYDSPSSGSRHSGLRDTDGTVQVDGTSVPELADAVGAYAEHLLVAGMLGRDEDTVSFVQFDEGEPGGATQEAELHRCGSEQTELLDGSTVHAERIQLVVDGRPTNAHWCVDGLVVKSDWCGAQSFLVDDLDVLCAGLDQEVAGRIREFAARRVKGGGPGPT